MINGTGNFGLVEMDKVKIIGVSIIPREGLVSLVVDGLNSLM